jgi:hypothetical protein
MSQKKKIKFYFLNTINADYGNLPEIFIVFFSQFFNKSDNKNFKILNLFLLE